MNFFLQEMLDEYEDRGVFREVAKAITDRLKEDKAQIAKENFIHKGAGNDPETQEEE